MRFRLTLLALLGLAWGCQADRPVYRPDPDPGPPPQLALAQVAPGPAIPTATAQPPAPSPADAAARRLWTMRCSSCHGRAGLGDGPAGRLIRPKPVSFADKAWQASATDEAIEKIIIGGGLAVGRSPSMPASPDLKGPQAKALVKLIRSFGM